MNIKPLYLVLGAIGLLFLSVGITLFFAQSLYQEKRQPLIESNQPTFETPEQYPQQYTPTPSGISEAVQREKLRTIGATEQERLSQEQYYRERIRQEEEQNRLLKDLVDVLQYGIRLK